MKPNLRFEILRISPKSSTVSSLFLSCTNLLSARWITDSASDEVENRDKRTFSLQPRVSPSACSLPPAQAHRGTQGGRLSLCEMPLMGRI